MEFDSKSALCQSDSKDDQSSQYVNRILSVLEERFKYGFRETSVVDIRKFIKTYSQKYGEIPDSESTLLSILKTSCVLCDNVLFHPELMIPKEIMDRIYEYIKNSFEKGIKAIYYDAIFLKFEKDLSNTLANTANKLRASLQFYLKNEMPFNEEMIFFNKDVEINPLNEIRSLLINQGIPLSTDTIHSNLSHLSLSTIKDTLLHNDEFIQNGTSIFFHKSSIDITSNEISIISNMISSTISNQDFLSTKELYEAIVAKLPTLSERNGAISQMGWREYLKTELHESFSFNGSIVTDLKSSFTMNDAFIWFTKTHKEFNLNQLNEFASSLGRQIDFESVYINSIRISKHSFIDVNLIEFDTNSIDAVLESYCCDDYVALSSINTYSTFPECGYPWNEFLLEQYVSRFSKKFKIIHRTYATNSVNGAIVRSNSRIDSMKELIVRVLIDSKIELQKDIVLDYLATNGYIARRAYDGIESLIIEASAKKTIRG